MPVSPALLFQQAPSAKTIAEEKSPGKTKAKKVVKKKSRASELAVTQSCSTEACNAPIEVKKRGKKLKKKSLLEETTPAPAPDDLFSKSGWKAAVKREHEKAEQKKHSGNGSNSAVAEGLLLEDQDEGERVDRELDDITAQILSNKGPVERKRKAAGKAKCEPDALDKVRATKIRSCENSTRTSSTQVGVQAFRKAHEIIVSSNCPAPLETFGDAAALLGDVLTKTLKSQGFLAPTPIQAQAWPIALEGNDMISVAKTGSGKTCGFLIPAFARLRERPPAEKPKQINHYQSEPARPSTLVMAPTRELVQQIAVEADRFADAAGVRVVSIYGGVPKGDHVRALKQGADVLIATPGRLIDFSEAKPEKDIRACVDLCNVNYLVLDEADRMLDMGFEADIRKIVGWCKPTGLAAEAGGASGPKAGSKRQTLFFTATWPKAVQRTAASLTSSSAVQIRIGQDSGKLTANKNVTQIVSVLPHDSKLQRLDDILGKELKAGETAIVFAATKGGCDYLERHVKKVVPAYWCGVIHSGREQWERDETLAKFRDLTTGTSQQRGVLIATDVAARGLDIPGVAMVVVYDFSTGQGGSGIESYVHRIGRTGRAGLHGRAFTFFMPGETNAREFVELLKGAQQHVPDEMAALGAQDKGTSKGGKSKGKGKGAGKSKGKGFGKGKKGNGGKSWSNSY